MSRSPTATPARPSAPALETSHVTTKRHADGTCHGERQLGSGTKTSMRRQCPVHMKAYRSTQLVERQKSTRVFRGPRRILPRNVEAVRGPCRHEHAERG